MTPSVARRVPLATAPNMRDLGGIETASGVVRSGVVYRSASLSRLDTRDQAAFDALGIETIYDLRTAAERAASPDAVGQQTRILGLDVLADSSADVAADLGQLASDPSALAATLQGGRGVALMEESYRNIVTLPSALAAYRAFFLDLIDPERDGAALFHCTTGKDRTGWAAASLLLLLGADEEDVRADYLQTNEDLLPALQPLISAAEERGADAVLLMPILSVQEDYLDAALDEVRDGYGSVEGYARSGLGLSPEQLTALRQRFVLEQG